MKKRVVYGVLGLLLAALAGTNTAFAEGASNGRERFFLKRQNCTWTAEMGQYIYDCVKKHDGFNAHWCHNEALDVFCPADENAIPHPTDASPGQAPAEPEADRKN
jgi:hypothetical protein